MEAQAEPPGTSRGSTWQGAGRGRKTLLSPPAPVAGPGHVQPEAGGRLRGRAFSPVQAWDPHDTSLHSRRCGEIASEVAALAELPLLTAQAGARTIAEPALCGQVRPALACDGSCSSPPFGGPGPKCAPYVCMHKEGCSWGSSHTCRSRKTLCSLPESMETGPGGALQEVRVFFPALASAHGRCPVSCRPTVILESLVLVNKLGKQPPRVLKCAEDIGKLG